MEKPILTFNQVAPLILEKYERYLPSAFDDSLTILEKMHQIINYLNQIGEVTNLVVEQWNQVMEWVMLDGITDVINQKLDMMVTDGTLDDIINKNLFGELNQEITNVKTSVTTLRTDVNKRVDDAFDMMSDPRAHGAVGDGKTDDTVALEKWMAAPGRSKVLRSGIFLTRRGLISTEDNRNIMSDGGILKAVNSAEAEDIVLLTVTGNDTTVTLNLDGNERACGGVLIDGAKGCRVVDCRIKNMLGITIGGYGVQAKTNLGVVIQDNTIENIDSRTNNVIGDNTGASRGILLTDKTNSNAVYPSRIIDNHISNIIGEEGDAIQVLFYNGTAGEIFSAAFAEVKGNTIFNANRRAIKIQASHVVVSDNKHFNTLTDVPNAANLIDVLNAHYVSIENNQIDAGKGFMGISAQGSGGVVLDNITISGNVIRGSNERDAIYVDQITDSSIDNNVIYNGRRAIALGNADGVSVKNNIVMAGDGNNMGINISQTCDHVHVIGNTQPSGNRNGFIALSGRWCIAMNNHSAEGTCVIGSSTATNSLVKDNTNYSGTKKTYIGDFSNMTRGDGYNLGGGGAF